MRNFTVSTLDEIFAVVVNFLGNPKEGLWNEGLVASAEMEMVLIAWCVQFGLDCFVDVG